MILPVQSYLRNSGMEITEDVCDKRGYFIELVFYEIL